MLFATAELRRSKVRFGLLTVAAGLLVFVLLFQQALLTAVLDGMSGALRRQSGPVLVYARDAQRSFAGSLVTSEQAASVSASPGVADAGELGVTLLSYRLDGSGEDWVNVSVIGYRRDRPGSPVGLSQGRMPRHPGEAVFSSEDAGGRLGVGDTIVVEPGGVPVEVVGLTRGGRWAVGPTLWAPWETYERLVWSSAPETPAVLASVMAVRPDDGIAPEHLVEQLNRRFPDLEALTRDDAAAATPGLGAVRAAFGAVLGLGYLVVAVLVGFFFLTMALHKQESVRVLRAMGARAAYLVRCLLAQVAVVSLGGLLLGVAAMLAATRVVSLAVPLAVDPTTLRDAGVAALAVALLGAMPAVRRVVRTEPALVVTRQMLGGTA